MSLFKARDWSSTWCGSSEEEFDYGSLSIANIDNDPSQFGIDFSSLSYLIRPPDSSTYVAHFSPKPFISFFLIFDMKLVSQKFFKAK